MSAADPRILILEDEPLIAAELEETLKQLGYTVVGPAHSCEAALELLWSGEVDAAILDLEIGQGTCEVVANELVLSDIPWALASGDHTHELHERFPATPVIPKPSEADRVAVVMKDLLEAVPLGSN